MAADPIPPIQAQIPPEVIRTYANFLLVQPGGMDVTISMGHQIGFEPVAWTVRVTMAWEEAKFLSAVLQAQLENYEREMGPIRDVMTRAAEVAAKQAEDAETGDGGDA